MDTTNSVIRKSVLENIKSKTTEPEGCRGLNLIHIIIIVIAGIFTAGIGTIIVALYFIINCDTKRKKREEYFSDLGRAEDAAYQYKTELDWETGEFEDERIFKVV